MNWNQDDFCLDLDFGSSLNIFCSVLLLILCLGSTLVFFKKQSNFKIFLSRENFDQAWLNYNRKTTIAELIPNTKEKHTFLLQVDNAVRLLIEEEVPQHKWDFLHGRAAELYKLRKPKSQIQTAVHEAGHVLCFWFSKNGNSAKIKNVSIIPNGVSLGRVTLKRHLFPETAEECFGQMCGYLGGTLAHSIFFPSETQRVKRAGEDFLNFAAFAKTMGYTQYHNLKDKKNRSEWEFVCFYLRHSFIATLTVIKAHERDLVEIVKNLLEHNELNLNQLKNILGDDEPEHSLYEEFVLKPQPERLKTTVEEMLQAVQETEEENEIDEENFGYVLSKLADKVAEKAKRAVLKNKTEFSIYFSEQENPEQMDKWRVMFVKKALKGKKLKEEDFLNWMAKNEKEEQLDSGYQRLDDCIDENL